MLISFSGLDGAGKTTHIDLTTRYLEDRGHEIKVLRMYDHVSVSALLRKKIWRPFRRASPTAQRGSTTPIEPQEKKVTRKAYRHDKNRKGPVIVTLRQLVYVADLIVFLSVTTWHETLRGKTIICDRHLIDSIVNLADTNRLAELYARALLFVVPKPDLPILLDVDAQIAFDRKPEYPLAYNVERRQAYLAVFRRLRNAAIVPSTTIPEVQQEIEQRVDMIAAKT
jgi:thymidylate kinase